jgi:hypothetical protein
MSGVSSQVMFAVLVSLQPPDATAQAEPQGEASALPRYDEAPAPVASVDPAAPTRLTPEKARHSRRVGTGLLIAGGVLLAGGIAGLIVGISGVVAIPEYGDDFFESQRRAEQRQSIGFLVGGPCTGSGVAFLVVGGALRAQARSAPKLQVSIVPTWLYGGGGLVVGGRF